MAYQQELGDGVPGVVPWIVYTVDGAAERMSSTVNAGNANLSKDQMGRLVTFMSTAAWSEAVKAADANTRHIPVTTILVGVGLIGIVSWMLFFKGKR